MPFEQKALLKTTNVKSFFFVYAFKKTKMKYKKWVIRTGVVFGTILAVIQIYKSENNRQWLKYVEIPAAVISYSSLIVLSYLEKKKRRNE